MIRNALGLLLTIFSLSTAHAGFPCPPDSCNPYNGCMEGCPPGYTTCGTGSDHSCLGKEFGSSCTREAKGQRTYGYCEAGAIEPILTCGCE